MYAPLIKKIKTKITAQTPTIDNVRVFFGIIEKTIVGKTMVSVVVAIVDRRPPIVDSCDNDNNVNVANKYTTIKNLNFSDPPIKAFETIPRFKM